ncbi:hypothetical protein [Paraburkholderia phymatum]|uniref:hypothetical protein n=1 Tax=Paraburkholderia phymatum TaxID=148447 RepID=UPI003F75254E
MDERVRHAREADYTATGRQFLRGRRAGGRRPVSRHLLAGAWTPDTIGTVLTLGGIVGMLVTAPAGALVDATSHRRAVVVGAGALSIVAACVIWLSQRFWPVTLSQIAAATAGAAMGPDGWPDARHDGPQKLRPAIRPQSGREPIATLITLPDQAHMWPIPISGWRAVAQRESMRDLVATLINARRIAPGSQSIFAFSKGANSRLKRRETRRFIPHTIKAVV